MRIIGTHSIRQAICSGSKGVLYITRFHTCCKEYESLILQTKAEIIIKYCGLSELKKEGVRQGAVLILDSVSQSAKYIFNLSTWLEDTKEKEKLLILVLDHIQDVQNLGAIFRSSLLFDVDLVITSTKRAAPENEFAIKASAGALPIMPRCKVVNIAESIKLLKKYNIWTYALDMNGKNIIDYNLSSRTAFLLGSENTGLSSNMLNISDDVLSIPIKKAPVDSLNVSVSAAIACYEYVKQCGMK